MKPNVEQKLVEILGAIQSGVTAAGDFAMEQLPGIAAEYVAYGRLAAMIDVLIAVVMLVVGVLICRGLMAHINKFEDYSDANPVFVVGGVPIAGGLLLCGGIGLLASMKESALVWLAPKVWLIQEIAKLVK